MLALSETRLHARGLHHPAPIHLLRSQLDRIHTPRLRLIVNHLDAAEGVLRYCRERDVAVILDTVGDDFHLLVDLRRERERLLQGDLPPENPPE